MDFAVSMNGVTTSRSTELSWSIRFSHVGFFDEVALLKRRTVRSNAANPQSRRSAPHSSLQHAWDLFMKLEFVARCQHIDRSREPSQLHQGRWRDPQDILLKVLRFDTLSALSKCVGVHSNHNWMAARHP